MVKVFHLISVLINFATLVTLSNETSLVKAIPRDIDHDFVILIVITIYVDSKVFSH